MTSEGESARVPVIRQVDATECGAACLAMIVGAHGLDGDLDACRRLLPAGARGIDAASLADAARRLGLRVWAYRAPGRAALEELPLPAILHWSSDPENGLHDDHFVVLESRSERGAQLVDPAHGRRRMPWGEVEEHAAGIALTFAPDAVLEQIESVHPSFDARVPLWLRVGALEGTRPALLIALGGGVSTAVLAAVGAYVADQNAPSGWLLPILGLWIAVVLWLHELAVVEATRRLGEALSRPEAPEALGLPDRLDAIALETRGSVDGGGVLLAGIHRVLARLGAQAPADAAAALGLVAIAQTVGGPLFALIAVIALAPRALHSFSVRPRLASRQGAPSHRVASQLVEIYEHMLGVRHQARGSAYRGRLLLRLVEGGGLVALLWLAASASGRPAETGPWPVESLIGLVAAGLSIGFGARAVEAFERLRILPAELGVLAGWIILLQDQAEDQAEDEEKADSKVESKAGAPAD